MEIGIIIICIILSAFFSGIEIAYVSSNKIQLEIEKKQKKFLSKILSKITKSPSKLITTMLIGNAISLVIYGFYFGELIIKWLFPQYTDSEGLPIKILLTQTVISTLLILITGEFLPKVFFRVYSNTLFKVFIIPSYFFYYLFYPITSFLMGITNGFLKYVLKTPSKDRDPLIFSKTELNYYLSEQIDTVAESQEDIDSGIEIFRNALNFTKLKARDVMVPRTDICAINLHETPKKLSSLFIESGFSKILIFNETIDDIIGYVYSFQLFKKPKTIKSVLLPIEYVPETMLIKNILNIMIRKRKSIAVILDEFGGTSGIITVEDIIEELLGEIEDEHDSEDFLEEQISESEYNFSARLEVNYINKTYRINLPESENYETLGGLVVSASGDIPAPKEIIKTEGFRFTIIEGSENKVETIHVKLL